MNGLVWIFRNRDWFKALFGLQSGKVYIQRCIQPSSPSSQKHTNQTQTAPKSKMQDLNFPPSPRCRTTLSLFEDSPSSDHLKYLPDSPSKAHANYNIATYQSVCTLDKVRSALDRAWRVSSSSSSSSSPRKRPSPSNSASDDLNSNNPGVVFGNGNGNGMMVAGACPNCLLYVLISQTNPKCPKCSCVIPLPDDVSKKTKIDLNISIWDQVFFFS